MTNVIPIQKNNKLSNYRPIHLLHNPGKLLEKTLNYLIKNFIRGNEILINYKKLNQAGQR